MSVFAYFGPAGTFTEMALDQLLSDRLPDGLAGGTVAERIAAPNPAAAIDMVRRGEADFACVPIESSLEGSVPATMDALTPDAGAGRVQVYAEVILDIAFTIAARRALDADEVRTIAAYPVASAQVRVSIEQRYPAAQFRLAASNAAAAQDVRDGVADAAVTTPPAAALNGLVPIAENISDAADAVTRFVLVGRPARSPARTGADRTSVILDLTNEPGSLMAAMNEFASRGIDLTRIESRPRKAMPADNSTSGKYWFFLDAVGHIDDDAVGEALRALYRRCDRVVFLGSWGADRGTGAPPPDNSESARWFDAIRRGEAE